MTGSGVLIGRGLVLTAAHVIYPRHAGDLRRGIEDVSRLRNTLAHEDAHLQLESRSPNFTGMTVILGGIDWLTVTAWLLERPQGPSTDAVSASAPLAQYEGTEHGFARLPGSRLLLAFREDVLLRDNGNALLRLFDGILAALRLALVLVLAALSQHPDALIFVLIMLAACLRYGHRGEPDDHALPALPSISAVTWETSTACS